MIEVPKVSREEFAGTSVEKALQFRDDCLDAIMASLADQPQGTRAVDSFNFVKSVIYDKYGIEYTWDALEHHVRVLEAGGLLEADQGFITLKTEP